MPRRCRGCRRWGPSTSAALQNCITEEAGDCRRRRAEGWRDLCRYIRRNSRHPCPRGPAHPSSVMQFGRTSRLARYRQALPHDRATRTPRGNSGLRVCRPVLGRRLREAAARRAARARARAAVRRGLQRPAARRRAVYFELRDGDGAVPCAMWRNDVRRAGDRPGGARRRRAGRRRRRPRLLPGQPRPRRRSFSFDVTGPARRRRGRPARPARGAAPQARRRGPVRAAEGAAAPAAAARRSASSPARAARRATTCSPACTAAAGAGGWCGRSRRSRTATPRRRSRARCSDLAALDDVDVIVVARGGGSLADLFAFCDETLCRTVALLRVPVIASVGHHTDRTLIDDVAAVSCSTPTHAAEAAVPLALRRRARAAARARARGCAATARRAILDRARDARARWRARRPSTSPATAARCTRRCARCAPRARRGVERAPRRTSRRRARVVLRRKAAALRARSRRAPPARSSGLSAALARPRPRAHARARLRAGRRRRRRASSRAPRRRARRGDVRLQFVDAAVDARIAERRDD